MSPFQALMIKDYRTTRKGLFVPIYILAGIYVVMIAAYIFAKIHGGQNVEFNMNFADIPAPFLTNMDFHALLSFSMQAIMFMSFFGIVVGISMVVISSTLLNHDIAHKCELFHRSQPVSVWEITGSRFLVGIVGSIVIAFVLGLINMVIVNILTIIATPMHINWWMSFNGLLLSFLHISVALLLLGSICYTLSAIFKSNAFGKGILGLVGIDVAIQIINYLFSFKIPAMSVSFFKYIMSGFSNLTTQITVQKYGAFTTVHMNTGSANLNTQNIAGFKLPPDFLTTMWATLFTWQILEKILICVALYVIATFIYQRREVQQ